MYQPRRGVRIWTPSIAVIGFVHTRAIWLKLLCLWRENNCSPAVTLCKLRLSKCSVCVIYFLHGSGAAGWIVQ